MRYRASEPPTDLKSIPQYLSGEMRRVEAAVAVTVVTDHVSSTAAYSGVPAGSYPVLGTYVNGDGELVVVYQKA